MLALADAQKAVATIAVFIATFLVTLSIGRLLKRRAGVPFGIFFQLFALALGFYAAVWVYGFDLRWRNHAGAALVLLSAAVVIALVDRYLWDLYFEQRRQTVIPKFLREIVALVIFLIALLLVLSFGYHAETQLRGLLATSGAAAIILAFATQNLLGGVIAGMALQINKPYKVGDWLQVGEHFAEVMEINWRSTRLRTNDAIYLDIPNNEIVRQTIINLHYPQQLHAMRIVVGVDYNVPPNKVKDALLQATLQAQWVEKEPEPKVFLKDFGDFAIYYEIKFYMLNHEDYNNVCDAIRTNIWYEFKRQGITIPFPIRTLEINRKRVIKPHEEHNQTKAILEGEALFDLSDERPTRSSHPRVAHGPLRSWRKTDRAGSRGGVDVCPAAWRGGSFGFAEWQHDPGRLPATWAIALAKCRSSPAKSGRRRCRGTRLRSD